MDEGPTSAESYLAYAKKVNAERAQQQRIDTYNAAKAEGRQLPDLNPADRAVARIQANAARVAEFKKLPPVDRNSDLRDRVARLESLIGSFDIAALEARVAAIEYGLANATGTLTCDDAGPGGTITLTFPEEP